MFWLVIATEKIDKGRIWEDVNDMWRVLLEIDEKEKQLNTNEQNNEKQMKDF